MSSSPNTPYVPSLLERDGIPLQATAPFEAWLESSDVSLAISFRHTNRLVLVSRLGGRLTAERREIGRAGKLAVAGDQLWIESGGQLWRYGGSSIGRGERRRDRDLIFAPRSATFVGELDLSALELTSDGTPLLVSSLLSAVGTPGEDAGFEPIWAPPFISRVRPESRCGLSGVTWHDGEPRFATVAARSDVANGWKHEWTQGGVIWDVERGEARLGGLSMPASPILEGDELFFTQRGRRRLESLDLATDHVRHIADLPGVPVAVRIHRDLLLVLLHPGASRPGEGPATPGACPTLLALARSNGDLAWSAQLPGDCGPACDLVILEQSQRPDVLGLRSDEARSMLYVSTDDGATHRQQVPVDPRPLALENPPGLAPDSTGPDAADEPTGDAEAALSSEPRVWTAELSQLLESHVDATFPNLERLVASRRLREPLTAVLLSASKGPGALSLVEVQPEHRIGEIVSFWVRPDLRRQGIGRRLLRATEDALEGQIDRITGVVRSSWHSSSVMERLLVRGGWSEPVAQRITCRLDLEKYLAIRNAEELQPLPEDIRMIDWGNTTEQQRERVQARQDAACADGSVWFPEELTPFQLEGEFQHGPSKALLQGDDIVGWFTCHVLTRDTLQYTALFVDPALRKLYLAMELAKATFNDHLTHFQQTRPGGLRYASFMTDARNPATVQWIDAWLRRYEPRLAELRWTEKILSSADHTN